MTGDVGVATIAGCGLLTPRPEVLGDEGAETIGDVGVATMAGCGLLTPRPDVGGMLRGDEDGDEDRAEDMADAAA